MSSDMGRRGFLSLAAAGTAGAMVGVPISGCSARSSGEAGPDPERQPQRAPAAGNSVLLAYFSRPGENYWNGGRRNLRIGNTEALAGIIADQLDCDVHRIQAADPYSEDYDETVQRNVREQNADARPGIANPLDSIDRYD